MRKNQKAEIRKLEILENYYQILIDEGFEGASIGKIAKRMHIHPSLIIHYFKTKENMTSELVDLLIEKYLAPEFLELDHITDLEQRFHALIDTLFSFEWSRTVNPGLHFGFYYLSFRYPAIHERYRKMIKRLRDYLIVELERFREADIIKTNYPKRAADLIITLMEGMEFQAHFLSEGKPFEAFAGDAKKVVITMLKNNGFSEKISKTEEPLKEN